MEKTFRYHKYLFFMAKKLPRVSLGIIAACWLPPIFLYVAVYHEPYMPLVRLAFVGSLTVTFAALLLAMILNELCNTVFIVSDTGLVKKSPYKVKVIHFERVVAFRYVTIPLLKGFGELSMAESSIRLPFLIEGLDECIEAIRQNLDAHAKQEAYDANKIHDFCRRARRSAAGIYRMQRTAAALFQVALWTMAGSAFVAQVFWNAQLRLVLRWAFIGLIFPFAGYLITLAFLNWKRVPEFIVDPKFGNQEEPGEHQAYRYAGAATAFAYLVAGILFKQLLP